MALTDEQARALQMQAEKIRETIITSLVAAGSGHTAGPLDMADIFTAFYFHILNHDPKQPEWEERDRLILSNGHICPVLYATLAHSGYFPVEECLTLRKFGSRLQGHPERTRLPGLETTSGPLGSGLSQASGVAYALRMDEMSDLRGPTSDVGPRRSDMGEGGGKRRVYCLMSDGEQEEGNTWEAAMFAGKNKLSNLTAVMDRNNIQIDGNTEDVMPLEPLADKYRAFNWHVLEVNGHDIPAFIAAVEEAKAIYEKPTLIIAHTISGKGVPEIEGDYHWHGKPPTALEGKRFLEQIQRGFTLIELLVVIAIIGILSAVVLASLSTARSRGNDAAVKQSMHGVQVQAELYSIGNGDYGFIGYSTACNAGMFTDLVIARAKANVDSSNGSAGKVYCYANSSEYLMIADLSSGYWCIDSTGAAKEKAGAAPVSLPTDNVCPL
ncbi:prepilin-type N-terminal cleavage/methylation domain-containing protein [bacterium]|nr:MAG: prepilin-type N-terminal cleavage/methylation domain-containing protein [bacterium]